MVRAVIVSTARTGLAKSFRGGFNATHGAALGGHAIAAALKKANIDPGLVEDVIMGCGMPEGETGMNIARNAAMWADCPVTVSGQTVNRFCSSGLQVSHLHATPASPCPQPQPQQAVRALCSSFSCLRVALSRSLLAVWPA